MGQVPAKPGPLGTKFRVIGAGMSRTGTKSFNEALTILLGGPVHDSGILSLGGTNHQIRQWLEIMRVAPQASTLRDKKYLQYLLADVLDGYVASVDCPAVTLTPELLELFPDALVIVTTRDPDSWWTSMEFMHTMLSNWYLPWLVLWVPKLGVYALWRARFRLISRWRYGTKRISRDTLEKHEDHLRAVVPADRLFFYDVRDGWEPLCSILGVPVPKQPFPHNNSTHDAGRLYRDTVIAGLVSWAFMLVLAFLVAKLAFLGGRVLRVKPLGALLGCQL